MENKEMKNLIGSLDKNVITLMNKVLTLEKDYEFEARLEKQHDNDLCEDINNAINDILNNEIT